MTNLFHILDALPSSNGLQQSYISPFLGAKQCFPGDNSNGVHSWKTVQLTRQLILVANDKVRATYEIRQLWIIFVFLSSIKYLSECFRRKVRTRIIEKMTVRENRGCPMTTHSFLPMCSKCLCLKY